MESVSDVEISTARDSTHSTYLWGHRANSRSRPGDYLLVTVEVVGGSREGNVGHEVTARVATSAGSTTHRRGLGLQPVAPTTVLAEQ
jgi:hypothetical protein